MADVTIRFKTEEAARARADLKRVQGEIIGINSQLAVNRRRLVDATGAEKESLQATNRRLAAERGLLAVQRQRTSALLPGLREEIRMTTEAVRASNRFATALGGVGSAIGFLAVDQLTFHLTEFVRGTIDAAVKVEGFRNSLTALYGDAQIANRVLEDLRELSQLPGITFEGAVESAVRLKTVGVEGERALRVIREFGNAAALSGASTIEMTRAIVGFTQNLSRGQIEQDNLNQILENVPLIGNSIKLAFNSIDAEVIRDQLDAAGQSVQDFADILVNQLSMGARASADTTANAFSNLRNATFELQTVIGEGLSPVARDAALGLTGLFSTITDGIRSLQELSTATEVVSKSVFNTNAAFSDRASIVSYVESLRDLRSSQQELIDQAGWWQYTADAAEGVAELTRWINLYEDALSGVPTASEALRAELSASDAQYAQLLANRVEILSSLKEERESIFGNVNLYQDQYDANEELIAQNREKAAVLKNVVNSLEDTTAEEDEASESARLAAIVQKVLSESYLQSADAAKELATGLRLVRETIIENRSEQQQLNQFWQFASGALGDYQGAIETTIPSVVNLESEQDALQSVFEGFEDPLADYVAGLESTSGAADEATGHLNRVSTSVRQSGGDIDAAAANLRDFDDAFQLSEVTIPRVTSAMREFTGTAPDVDRVTEAVKSSTRSVEDLLDEIDAIGDGTEALNAIETAFWDLAQDTIPDVTRDIVDAFVGIAEGDDINDAFGRLGTRVGNTLIDEMSGVISEQLSGAIIGKLQSAGISSIGGQITGLASALASPIGIFAAGAAAFTFAAEELATLVTPEGKGPDRTLALNDPNRLVNVGGTAGLDFVIPPIQIDNIEFDGEAIRQALETVRPLDTLTSRGAGTGRFGARVAGNIALAELTGTDRQAIEDVAREQYGAPVYDAEFAAATSEGIEATEDVVEEADETLQTVFRFTAAQSDELKTFRGEITKAEDAIKLLNEDSSAAEVTAAYTALATAETNYYNKQLEFINAGKDVFTDDALERARINAGGKLRERAFDANQTLVRSLDKIGFELVSMFDATSGFLSGSSLAIQKIAEDVSSASQESKEAEEKAEERIKPIRAPERQGQAVTTEPISTESDEPEDPEPLRDVFRLTGAQSATLGELRGNITTARNAVRALTEDSTAKEVITAYQDLGKAEQAYFDKTLEFIDAGAGVFTDDALETARGTALNRFENSTFSANDLLVGALDNIGYELVNTFSATAGILSGTALAIQQIPQEVEQVAGPEALRDRFTLPSGFGSPFATLEGDVSRAEQEYRRLLQDENATPEQLTEAYTELTTAQGALFTAQRTFIENATGITEEARTNALASLDTRSQRDIFNANTQLVGGLGDLGFQLTTTITDWFSIITEAMLAIEQIPEQVVPESPAEDERVSPAVFARNRLNLGLFNLGQSGSEREFEDNRLEAIRLTNEFYDAEEQRLIGLGLAEDVLRDKIEDNDLARIQAISRLTNLTNDFAEDRISAEERVAEETRRIQESEVADRIRRERELQRHRFAIEDIGIGSERGIGGLLRGSDYISRIRGLAGLDPTEALVQDLAERFDLDTNFAGGGVRVGGRFFAPGEELAVQSAEAIRRQLTPIHGFPIGTSREEIDNLILGIQSQQRRAIEGIEDENRQRARDLTQESLVTATSANTDALLGLTTAITDGEVDPAVVAETPTETIVGTPAEVENMDSALTRAGMDAGTEFQKAVETAGTNFKTAVGTAGTDFKTAVGVAVTALQNIASRGGAGGSQTFLLQFPTGAAIEIGNQLIAAEEEGSFPGFSDT